MTIDPDRPGAGASHGLIGIEMVHDRTASFLDDAFVLMIGP